MVEHTIVLTVSLLDFFRLLVKIFLEAMFGVNEGSSPGISKSLMVGT